MSEKIHKAVVASDSFKGSLSSLQVADGVERGIHSLFPDCKVVKLAVADGGEGTMDALMSALGGREVRLTVADPLGRPVAARYAILDDASAVVEMSQASGLTLLEPHERNPLETSTYGTGELIADALNRGCRRFLVGIGGSATNDAGTGMMEALGCRFLDIAGNPVKPCGKNLGYIAAIDMSGLHPGLKESEFIVACDVDSPFYGPDGAAYVYGPQKGADEQMTEYIDKGMISFAGVIAAVTGIDVSHMPGAGAAGGLGGALKAFMSARLCPGADMVLDAVGFDEALTGADLVITGEGRIDSQTLTGKLPYAVAMRAHEKGVPVIAVCGQTVLGSHPLFTRICPITPPDIPLQSAMNPSTALSNLICTIASSLRSI